MSMRRLSARASIKAAILVAAVMLVQPLPAQTISGKQQQAEDIPSTSQALAGRLFFSREQRERLDRARAGGGTVVEADIVDPPVSRINGFVKRSDGDMAVWIDGRMRRLPANAGNELVPGVVGGSANNLRVKLANEPLAINVKAGKAKPMTKRGRKVLVPTRANPSLRPRN